MSMLRTVRPDSDFLRLAELLTNEDDIGLIEILHQLGVRFMQLSYNNQSLLATGCYEAEDPVLPVLVGRLLEK